jgi:uncharacterized membrane protein
LQHMSNIKQTKYKLIIGFQDFMMAVCHLALVFFGSSCTLISPFDVNLVWSK